MTTRVRVITGEVPALVLSCPRDADPVFGEGFTELAHLPPHFEQEFTLNGDIDLLLLEGPFPAAAEQVPASDDAPSERAEAGLDWPTASLREADPDWPTASLREAS
jgi:hypothetical protein